MKSLFIRRIDRARQLLRKNRDGVSALLVGANPPIIKQHSSVFAYRSNSNLYYLSGCETEGSLLLIRSDQKDPTLLVPKRSQMTIRYDGKGEDLPLLAGAIGARLVLSADPVRDVVPLLRGVECLHAPYQKDSPAWRVANYFFQLQMAARRGYPYQLFDADQLMSELRVLKDADEISAIRDAADITHHALYAALPLIVSKTTEAELAGRISGEIIKRGALLAFDPIVATGAAAATFHYNGLKGRLKPGELVVFDCGARLRRYSADITRTVPVNGHFTPMMRQVYDVVLEANMAGIAAVRPGVTRASVYLKMEEVLTRGLVSLKVLKGSVGALLKKNAYAEWCAHPLGHSLGLDVHDLGWFNHADTKLETGMVFTIEPGLYFTRAIGKVPRCGVRIEDNVLVTAKGCEVLTAGTKGAPQFPKDPDTLCELFS